MSKSNDLTLSQAFEGFIKYKTATGRSDYTLRNYRNTLKKTQQYFPTDPVVVTLTVDDWVGFFAWLRDTVFHPDGAAKRPGKKLSSKTRANIHTNLSAFYTWLVKRQVMTEHLFKLIECPNYDEPVIIPFTQAEVKELLRACRYTQEWRTKQSRSQRPTALRDQLIVLTLLDTGVRASELCDICYGDLDLNTNSIKVAGKGKGTGKKERVVFIGKRTARLVWDYLMPNLSSMQPKDPFITVQYGRSADQPLTRRALAHLLNRLGERANIPNVHPHRFRHTFAINYLRNGGDVLTLQTLLGHSDLRMVKHYARIVSADCANVHATASPVDNWKL